MFREIHHKLYSNLHLRIWFVERLFTQNMHHKFNIQYFFRKYKSFKSCFVYLLIYPQSHATHIATPKTPHTIEFINELFLCDSIDVSHKLALALHSLRAAIVKPNIFVSNLATILCDKISVIQAHTPTICVCVGNSLALVPVRDGQLASDGREFVNR